METFHYSIADSPAGPLAIVMSDKGLHRLEFHRKNRIPDNKAAWIEDPKLTSKVRSELDRYFAG